MRLRSESVFEYKKGLLSQIIDARKTIRAVRDRRDPVSFNIIEHEKKNIKQLANEYISGGGISDFANISEGTHERLVTEEGRRST